MDRLLSMEVFIAVVDEGSFTAAAEQFSISPAMVGKHVRSLEERLGVRLLQRTTRRQRLTEIGEQCYARCKVILEEIRAVENAAEIMRGSPRGLLRITAPVTLGTLRLAAILPEYLDRHPDVSVELSLSDRVVGLVDEGFDAAVRIGPLGDSTLIARALAPYRMLICASPSYLARAGRPRTPVDLTSHQCLGFTHWGRQTGWRLGRRDVSEASLPVPRLWCDAGQALRVAAVNGFGIILQPEVLLAEDVAAGRLVPLLDEFLPAPAPVHLLYARDRAAVPKLTTFVEFVVSRLAPPRSASPRVRKPRRA